MGASWTVHLADEHGKAFCAALAEEKIRETENEAERLPSVSERRIKLERRVRSLRGRLSKIAKEDHRSAAEQLPSIDLCDACRGRLERFPQLRNRVIAARAGAAA